MMGRWSIRALVILAILIGLLGAFLFEESHDVTRPMGEVIGPDEGRAMADAIASALVMINNTRNDCARDIAEGNDRSEMCNGGVASPLAYRRDVHVKSHGCLKAKFTVNDLESKYRWGVFREPGSFPAWIRFSSGMQRIEPDSKWDARGMAIKLMEVEGKKLLASKKNENTQDFVMMNSPNYFIRDLDDYVELTKYLARGDDIGYFVNGRSLNPLSWRWRELRLVLGSKKPAPDSLLDAQFFSASAYKLGPDHNIKFSVRPRTCATDADSSVLWETPRSDENFLRKRMIEQLGNEPACFDFMVQMQIPGRDMPVEDSTIVWDEDDSPFVTVASLEIPKQTFDTPEQNEFCENLSFNPWHSLPEHRPIGVFNRVRKALYEEVARYRWAENRRLKAEAAVAAPLNDWEPPEPRNWCLDGDPEANCDPVVAVP